MRDIHLQAGVTGVIAFSTEPEATIVLVDVTMSEQQSSHDNGAIFRKDKLLDYHLFDDAISQARDVVFLEIEEHDTGLETSSEVEQRVKTQGCDVRSSPSVSTFLDVFLVLDPTRGLAPFAFFPDAVKLVQLDENLVGRMVVHFLEGLVGYSAFLSSPDLDCRMACFVSSHSTWIVAPVRLQVVDVEFLERTRLFRLHTHSSTHRIRYIRKSSA